MRPCLLIAVGCLLPTLSVADGPSPAPPPVFDCNSVSDQNECNKHNDPSGFDSCGWCTSKDIDWSGCVAQWEIEKLPTDVFDCDNKLTNSPTDDDGYDDYYYDDYYYDDYYYDDDYYDDAYYDDDYYNGDLNEGDLPSFFSWAKLHNKKYSGKAQFNEHFLNFLKSRERIRKANAVETSATYSVDNFPYADLDKSEQDFAINGGLQRPYKSHPDEMGDPRVKLYQDRPSVVDQIATGDLDIDWRMRGAVTGIKNQVSIRASQQPPSMFFSQLTNMCRPHLLLIVPSAVHTLHRLLAGSIRHLLGTWCHHRH